MRRLIQIVFVGICAFLGGVAVNLSPRLGASAAPALSVPAARLTATASELEQVSDRFEAVRFPSSKSTQTRRRLHLGFTERLQSPSLIKVFDPHGRLAQQLP